MKRLVTWLSIGALAGLAWFLLLRMDAPSAGSSAKQSAQSEEGGVSPSSSFDVSLPQKMAASVAAFYKREMYKALGRGDLSEWRSMAAALLNEFAYPREQAIDLIPQFLTYPNWEVRVTAASYLLELGVYEGVPHLQRSLNAFNQGENIEARIIGDAVTQLHQYHLEIDHQALWQAYVKTKSPRLLAIASVRQLPQLRELVPTVNLSSQVGHEWDLARVYLGMDDAASIERYRFLAGRGRESEVIGHWALWQATQEKTDLDFVISCAREGLGMEVVEGHDRAWGRDRMPMALSFLQITVRPEVTRELEQMAEFIARSPTGNSVDFGRVVRALFYVHGAYDFLDKLVMDFLRGPYRGPGVNRELLFNIAAARRTPEIETATKAWNPAVYHRFFVMNQGRPVENWAYDSLSIPINIPLPSKSINVNR